SRRGDRETLEVVLPAVRVRLGRLGARQVAVGEPKKCPAVLWHELDLHRGRARRDRIRAFDAGLPAPRVDEPVGRFELDELAGGNVTRNDEVSVRAAGTCVERDR